MIRRSFILISLLAILYGCGSTVKSALSPRYNEFRPYTVAVAPVIWKGQAEGEDKNIAQLFREMTADKLRAMNYRVLPLDAVDDKVRQLGPEKAKEAGPKELAADLNADAVLYIRITGWDKDRVATYASLVVGAAFELYSSGAEMLWRADYSTKESDFRLEKKPLELAVIKIYEPRVQRFIDAVFSTLPEGSAPAQAQKTFFQWLP
ncbi:MAG: hypothetical protein Q7T24_02555 [Deltaproteobacteria bacterium]|nr:hypothetical protein [Deltaproteobacteria bacterium]